MEKKGTDVNVNSPMRMGVYTLHTIQTLKTTRETTYRILHYKFWVSCPPSVFSSITITRGLWNSMLTPCPATRYVYFTPSKYYYSTLTNIHLQPPPITELVNHINKLLQILTGITIISTKSSTKSKPPVLLLLLSCTPNLPLFSMSSYQVYVLHSFRILLQHTY